MNKTKKRKEKQKKQFEMQTKYAGFTKAQVNEAKKNERVMWNGIRPAYFDDKRNKKRDKAMKKELHEYY